MSSGLRVDSVVLALQLRAVAKTRSLDRLGQPEFDTLARIEDAIKITPDLD